MFFGYAQAEGIVYLSEYTIDDDDRYWEEHQWFSETRPATAYMVLIPKGEYWIGTNQEEIERFLKEIGHESRTHSGYSSALPKHKVELEAFYILDQEVTNKAYEEFMRFGYGGPPPSINTGLISVDRQFGWRGRFHPPGRAQFPVTGITRKDAERFCQWRSEVTEIVHRLPTEEEWEAAFRGKEGRLFPWGNHWDGPKFVPVNRRRELGPDPSFYPAQDDSTPDKVDFLLGNVHEFTSSYREPYPVAPDSLSDFEREAYDKFWQHRKKVDARHSERAIVIRGGAYDEDLTHGFPARREGVREHVSNYNIGFRYVIPVKDGKLVRAEPVKKDQTQ